MQHAPQSVVSKSVSNASGAPDALDIPLMYYPFVGAHDSATGIHTGLSGFISEETPFVQTQSLTIADQYSKGGARMFDLRVNWLGSKWSSWFKWLKPIDWFGWFKSLYSERLYFVHGPVPLIPIDDDHGFQELCEMAVRDKEVAVLLFTHFSTGKEVQTRAHMMKLLKERNLDKYVHGANTSVTMRHLHDTKKYLVLSMDYKQNYDSALSCFNGATSCSSSCLKDQTSLATKALRNYTLQTLANNKRDSSSPVRVVQTMFQAANGADEIALALECLGLNEQSIVQAKKSDINRIVIQDWLGDTNQDRVERAYGSTLLFDNVNNETLAFKQMTDSYYKRG